MLYLCIYLYLNLKLEKSASVIGCVFRDTTLSPCPLTVGLMYANRLKKKNSSFARQISSSDLFLVSMASSAHLLASCILYVYLENGCESRGYKFSRNVISEEIFWKYPEKLVTAWKPLSAVIL